MNVQIFYIATYGIVVIVNPFTAITIIWPIQAITNMYMLSSSRYIYIYMCISIPNASILKLSLLQRYSY